MLTGVFFFNNPQPSHGCTKQNAINATENTTAIAAQRASLKAKTQTLKDQVTSGQFQSVNAALLARYASEKHTTFNTCEGWIKAGKVVKKNSRPFLVWGCPVERTDEYGKTYSYFPVRYLYSNAQVVDQVKS